MVRRSSDWQLVFFTILTQMAVGIFIFWGLSFLSLPKPDPFSEIQLPSIMLVIVLGLLTLGTLSAGLHLGRPIQAILSISNLGESWLSREALSGCIFGLFVIILLFRTWLGTPNTVFDALIFVGGVISGLALVYVISRLYMLRTVPAWNNLGTPVTFFITTFLLGLIMVTAILVYLREVITIFGQMSKLGAITTMLVLLFLGAQFGIFFLQILYLNVKGGVAAESIRMLWTNLRSILIWRSILAFLGVGLLTYQLLVQQPIQLTYLAFGLILVSEILGRFLFYGFYRREGF